MFGRKIKLIKNDGREKELKINVKAVKKIFGRSLLILPLLLECYFNIPVFWINRGATNTVFNSLSAITQVQFFAGLFSLIFLSIGAAIMMFYFIDIVIPYIWNGFED